MTRIELQFEMQAIMHQHDARRCITLAGVSDELGRIGKRGHGAVGEGDDKPGVGNGVGKSADMRTAGQRSAFVEHSSRTRNHSRATHGIEF